MRVIVAGAGEVGFHLAKLLSGESQDIYLIDSNEERLEYAKNNLDVYTLRGDAKSLSILREANVNGAELLIAVTSSEETNILIAAIGKKLGAQKTIARVTNNEFLTTENRPFFHEMGIDSLISPTELASKEILRLVKNAALTENFEFEDGRLTMIGILIDQHTPIADKSIIEIAELNPNLSFMPVAINRHNKTIIPSGKTVFKAGDIVYFLTVKDSIDRLLKITGKQNIEVDNVMILGGSGIGRLTAKMLEKEFNVTLIERDKERSAILAEELKNTLVINADGTDVSTIEEEGIEDMDAFIAVTGDSETNIMASLVAKRHGVKKTIAQVENIYYLHLTQDIGIDTLINKKIIAASNIFRYVRKGQVSALANLQGLDAEIIEFKVEEGAKVTKKPIRDLNFPKNAVIAGVIRENESFIPLGGFQIKPNDNVVVFSLSESIRKVESFF